MARSTPGTGRRIAPHAALDTGTDLYRIGGLADALFAIVLTLLVLELRLPETSYTTDAGLFAGYLTLMPVLYAYILTFAVGSLHWIAHHRIVSLLTRYDSDPLRPRVDDVEPGVPRHGVGPAVQLGGRR